MPTRIVNTFNKAWSAAKEAWQEPVAKTIEKVESIPAISGVVQQPIASSYYVDTVSKVGEELPQVRNEQQVNNTTIPAHKGKVEYEYEKISFDVNTKLNQEERDFDKLQSMIYHVIMLMSRLAAKIDQQTIYELTIKIKAQAHEIKATYNTWQGLTITVISAGISIAGGVAGLTPFLPLSVIAAESSARLAQASVSIGNAGTGLGGLGSIFNNRSEGTRQVLQIYLKRSQDTEEERKGSKHSKGDQLKSAKAAAEEYARLIHEANKAATAA